MLKYKKNEAKEWIKQNFTGDIPTMITCFKEDGEVDYEAMRHNFRHILKFGTEGYAVNAFAGEQDSLTKEEQKKILELTVEEAQRNKVFAMTSIVGPLADVMERIKHAEDIGADAAWLWDTPGEKWSDEGTYQWYTKKGELKKAAELFYGEPLTSRREWILTSLRGGDTNSNYAHSMGVVNIPLFKYWHELMGFRGGPCRLPFLPSSEEEKKEISLGIRESR